MRPSDLDLPAKFSKWRRLDSTRTQYDAILAAACSDKRVVIINSPTGTGKSSIYMGLASFLGGRTLVLTESRNLQSQLTNDFGAMGLVEIKGQSNYPCLYFDDGKRRTLPGCDEGPCHAGLDCSLKGNGCRYYDAVRRASRSRLVVANYHYWMTLRRYADPTTLGLFDNLVLDEAHRSADALSDFVKIVIERRKVERLLEMITPREATVEEWVDWAVEALNQCRLRLENARNTVSLFHHGITAVRSLQELEGELQNLVYAQSWRRVDAPDPPAWVPGTATDWVVDETPKDAIFQPVWASGYAEQFLFAKIPRVFLVSATVTTKDAGFLGLTSADYDYHQYPSPFPVRNRMVYVVPSARVGRNMSLGEERVWMSRIDAIIQREAIDGKVKGIIHTKSYDRARRIFAMSRHQHLLVIHDPRDTRQTIARFKEAKAPAVLISPAVSTGHDFPLDECRFQIIAKVPFVDSRALVIKARAKSDRRYLDYVALVELIQMCGRGVRSMTDYCTTYIVDDNFGDWFWPRNKGLMPRWFRAALKRVRTIHDIPIRKHKAA